MDVLSLTTNWKFRKMGDQQWMQASVPGTVHTDLLANEVIPDPYYGSNEKDIQWIENCAWEYSCSFDIADSLELDRHCDLVFDGLDTYATVSLNDSLILVADNMFRNWRIDCKNMLKRGNNTLHIIFAPAVNTGRQIARMLPYTLPGDERVFTRKAQYQYGWDWGPRLVTCGIWRPVRFEMWEEFRAADVHIKTNSFNEKNAELTAEISVITDCEAAVTLLVQNTFNPTESVKKVFRLKSGTNDISIDFSINKPQLWWCNGHGDPFLYPVKISLISNTGRRFDKVIPYGIRKIEVLRNRDSAGESFVFRLNGKDIFAKGANYIPPDNFMPRVDSAQYAAIINDAVACHMNMLRVWGGGNYESDDFYRLCDEKGILIWQDLMFACAMYPGDSAFFENVRAEVEENVCRLRDHPCIALWCGNNEIDEGWHNWGWQKQYAYSFQDSSAIWNDYVRLFQKMIPGIITRLSPETPYTSSSPMIGWGHAESIVSGDSHYWGVWWGMEPFEVYEKKVPRFMSEFGFQGLPDMATIRTFTDSTGLKLFSDDLRSHQKHPTGFETIKTYMSREYPEPTDIDGFVYVSQLLQAQGIKRGIEAQRIAMPRCMGSLYWQMNDCWPVVSWSGRDYYGRWKALQYAVRDAFSDLMLSVSISNGIIRVVLVSDTTRINGSADLSLVGFNGTLLWSRITPAEAVPGQAQLLIELPLQAIITDSTLLRKCFLKVTFNSKNNGSTACRAGDLFFFTEPKNMELQKPDFDLEYKRFTDKYWQVSIETGIFAKNVQLSFFGAGASFSDNYFDLLPNEKKTVQCFFDRDISDPSTQIRIRSLYDILQNNTGSQNLK